MMMNFSAHPVGHGRQHTGFLVQRDSALLDFSPASAPGPAGPLAYDPLLRPDEAAARAHDASRERAGEGAGVGSAVGGALGTVAALGVASGGAFVVPGLGMVLAAPLAAAIAGAGVGAAVGGAFGALMGWMSPEEDWL
jgi:hypothetical protein